jgi:hypothetical protein
MPAKTGSALTALRSLRGKEGLSATEKELLEALTAVAEALDQRLSTIESKEGAATVPVADVPQGESPALAR